MFSNFSRRVFSCMSVSFTVTSREIRFLFGLTLVLFLLLSPLSRAQNLTGEIDGVVKDLSGAVISDATVTIRNTEQNLVVRTLHTDKQGQFTAPLLGIGHYSITIGASGFQTSTINDVEVHVNQPISIPAQLTPGTVSQTVSVTANQIAPQLDSNASGTLINSRQMTQLSLSSRNFEQLLYIQPGISGPIPGPKERGSIQASGSLNAATFSVNGQPTNANGYFVDGQDFVIHAGNQPSIFPGIDFIQETNFERSNYGAQYGGEGSAFTTLETKSGTSAFHGGAYEFFRSQILNANDYFNNLAGVPRPGIRYNDFGYDIGGPVWIPGLTKRESTKTFFYFGQEFLRNETQANETLSNIPTAAQRQGLFGAPVCVAYNIAGKCTQSAQSISQFDPTAQAYLTDIIDKTPLPNNPHDPQGLVATQQGFENETETFIRIDHQFSDKLSVFFRYLDDPFHLNVPYGIRQATGIPGVGTATSTAGGTAYLGHVTYIVDQNTVLEGGFSYLPTWLTAQPVGLLSQAQSPNIRPRLPYASTLTRVPDLHINGSSYATIAPYDQRAPIKQIFLNATHTAGRHNLNLGFSLDLNQSGNNNGITNAGSFTFNATALPIGSNATQFDQSFADFLLGRVSTFQQSSIDAASQIVQNYYEGYLQDDFHVTPRLTLNAGVRFSYIHQPTNNGLSGYQTLPVINFDPGRYSAAAAPTIGSNGLICTTAPCAGGTSPNPSYDSSNGLIVGGKTSPYGEKVTTQPNLNFAPRIGFAYDVFGGGQMAVRGGYGLYYMPPPSADYQTMVTLNPPNVTNTTISGTSFGEPGNGVPVLSATPLVLQATQPNAVTPYLQTWNLDVQKQLARNSVVDVGYFGNQGTHQGATEDINQPAPGAYEADGIVPGNGLTTGNSVLLNQIRPFKGYGPINSFNERFSSNYNSLQASFTQRLAHGNIVNVNYTWSKSLSNVGTPQSMYNLASEYGSTVYDRRHIFNANFVYLLPFYASDEGLFGHFLGGWQVTGIVSYGSGLYLTAHTINVDPGGVGVLATGSASVGTARPDVVSNPNSGASHNVTQWFNTAAFTQVPAGQYRPGDAPPSNILGPGYGNWDLSLFKNIKIEESANMQLRAESFNTFNHTNFSGVATTMGQSNYGQVTSAGSARILQLGAKLTF